MSDKEARKAIEKLAELRNQVANAKHPRDLYRLTTEMRSVYAGSKEALVRHMGVDPDKAGKQPKTG